MGHSRGVRDATGMLQNIEDNRRGVIENMPGVQCIFGMCKSLTMLPIHLQMLETSGLCQIWGMTK